MLSPRKFIIFPATTLLEEFIFWAKSYPKLFSFIIKSPSSYLVVKSNANTSFLDTTVVDMSASYTLNLTYFAFSGIFFKSWGFPLAWGSIYPLI